MPGSQRGHDRERLVRALLEAQGWWVARPAGSLGDADLVALRVASVIYRADNDHATRGTSMALLIEVKSTAGGPFERFGPKDRAELSAAAELAGAHAHLIWTPPSPPGVKGIHGCWIPESEWPASPG